MAGAGDPVGNGLVESLARPGRNVTGVAGIGGQLSGKLVEVARDTVPNTREIAVLANPTDIFTPIYVDEIKRVGRALGISTTFTMITQTDALEVTFETLRTGEKPPQAVIVQPSLPRAAAASLALAHRLPSFSPFAAFAEEGGLMGYGNNQPELFEQIAAYVDKIMRGAEAANLPVSQPTKFDLVINLRTARAIGVVVPPTVLALASSLLE
jgi:putative ABC transport system substrate-binding protein